MAYGKVNETRRATRLRKYTRRGRTTKSAKTRSNIQYNSGQLVQTNHKNKISVRKFPSLFPDKIMLKMTYTNTLSLSGVSGTLGNHRFRINSLQDIDVTGGGGQALGHDQWNLLYEKYRVHGTQYVFNCYTANTVPSNLCITSNDDSTSPFTNIQEATQQPNSSKIIQVTPDNGSAMLKGYVKCSTVLGLRQNEYASDDLTRAAFGAHPANAVYLALNIQALDGVSSVTISVQFRFTQYVEVFDRKELSGS